MVRLAEWHAGRVLQEPHTNTFGMSVQMCLLFGDVYGGGLDGSTGVDRDGTVWFSKGTTTD